MIYEQCKLCGRFLNDENKCNCKPFKVYDPEYYGEEEKTFYGNSEEEIIEKIAEDRNEEEPVFDENLFEAPVRITNPKGEIKFFNCHAIFDITYYAEEVNETGGVNGRH